MRAQKNATIEPQDQIIETMTVIDLQKLNHTELRMIYYEKFGRRIPYAVPRVSLIRSIEGNEPMDIPDLVESMRDNLVHLLGRYWNRIRSQIPCNGICYLCPDGLVIDCYRDNQQLMDGGAAMSRTTLDPNDSTLTLEKIEADGAAMEDRVFLLRFCVSNKWIEWGSKEMDQGPEFLWALVQEKMGGKTKTKKDKKKDKGKKKDKKKDKDKDKDKGNGVSKSKEPKFVMPPDAPAAAQERAAKAQTQSDPVVKGEASLIPKDLFKDLERARTLTKKKAKNYMEKFETMAKEVSEIKETLNILGSMIQGISNSLSGGSDESKDEDD